VEIECVVQFLWLAVKIVGISLLKMTCALQRMPEWLK